MSSQGKTAFKLSHDDARTTAKKGGSQKEGTMRILTLTVRTLEATLLPKSDLHRFTTNASPTAACNGPAPPSHRRRNQTHTSQNREKARQTRPTGNEYVVSVSLKVPLPPPPHPPREKPALNRQDERNHRSKKNAMKSDIQTRVRW